MTDLGLQALEDREKGQFPISIATSLALEGAFGILEDKPNPSTPPINGVEELWFNVRTLFRNMNGALKKGTETNVSTDDYAKALIEEIGIIYSIVSQRTAGKTKAYFYLCEYHSLTAIYRHALFKEVNTPNQKQYADMENLSIKAMLNTYRSMGVDPIMVFDTTLRGTGKRCVLITHYPLDLVSNKDMEVTGLLESHTGVLKTKAQWHTKLHNGKDLVRIPFDIMTVQLFGDSGNLLKPYPKEYRKEILDIADKYKWTPTTTKDRIKLTVQLQRKPQLEALVNKLYTTII